MKTRSVSTTPISNCPLRKGTFLRDKTVGSGTAKQERRPPGLCSDGGKREFIDAAGLIELNARDFEAGVGMDLRAARG